MKTPQGIVVLNLFRKEGRNGLTAEEVDKKLKMPRQSASSRVHELVRAGCLYQRVLPRENSKGKPVPVYEIASHATDEMYLEFMRDERDRPREDDWEQRVLNAARAYRLTPHQPNADRLLEVAKEKLS